MAHRFFEIVGREEELASGDASHPSANLQVTQSVMGLMENDVVEGTSDDDDYSSNYEEQSTDDSADQPPMPSPATLSLSADAIKKQLPYNYEPDERHSFNFEPMRRSKKPPNPVVNHLKTYYRLPSGSNYKDVRYSTSRKSMGLLRLQRSRSISFVDGRVTVCLDEIYRLLSCMVCRAVPITSLTVHICEGGHQVCGNCFGTGYRTCLECQNPLEGRNEVLEKVLQRLRQVCPGLFPKGGPIRLTSELQLKLDEAEKNSNFDKFKPVQHSTHRPLDCPHLSCRRVIAANGFLAHFQFEHSSVPVLQMSPHCAHQFGLSHRCFRNVNPRAIAIIEVNLSAEKYGAVRKYSCLTVQEKKATFPVRRDAVICLLLGASVVLVNNVFLLAWCACLHEEETPLTYCLRATSASGNETCYNGPTSSLHNVQDPARILKESQCLVLPSVVYGISKDSLPRKESITFDLLFNLK